MECEFQDKVVGGDLIEQRSALNSREGKRKLMAREPAQNHLHMQCINS